MYWRNNRVWVTAGGPRGLEPRLLLLFSAYLNTDFHAKPYRVDTVKPRSNGPATNGIPFITCKFMIPQSQFLLFPLLAITEVRL